MSQRPLGITLLAIWYIIGSIIFLLVIIAGRGTQITIFKTTFQEELHTGLVAIFGVLSIIAAYGLIKGLSWAWNYAIIMTILSVVSSIIIELNIFRTIWYLIIILYLTRPGVRSYFKTPEI